MQRFDKKAENAPHRRRERQPVKRPARRQQAEHEEPQAPLAGPQAEGKKAEAEQYAEYRVAERRRQPAARPAQLAQEVVDQARARAQQQGQQRLQQLCAYGPLHQPNRRLQKPPTVRSSS